MAASGNSQKTLVAGFGSAVVDVLMTTDSITLKGKNPVSHQLIQTGGVIPTALTVLARLGVKTELYTIIGTDMLGDKLISIFTNEHLGISHILRKPTMTTPLACVILEKDERTIFYTTEQFSRLSEPTFAATLTPSATYLLVDGHNARMAKEFISRAHTQKTKVILDLGTPKAGLDSLIAVSDTIIIPGAYWKTLPNHDPKVIGREFLDKGPSMVLVTMDGKGCVVATRKEIFYQPSYRVAAVDTNGAGDVFFGSFTYGLINQWALQETAQFAAAAAALSCTKLGKDAKIPRSKEEVLEFIKTNTASK